MLSLIVNPSSGGGRAAALLPAVRSRLSELGLEHHLELTRSLDHARALARAALDSGELAVAMGGDGLIGAVAGAVSGSEGTLGVLPGGRGNDFARVLGIPFDPVAACEVIAKGEIRALDLGQAGDRTFLGIASCGFDSEANRIANASRLIRGRLVYTYGGLRALIGWTPARFALELDGVRCEFTGYTVAVANSSAYGGGMFIAPRASMSDGLLDVVMIGEQSRLNFLRHLPKVFRGEHVDLPAVRVLRAREVRIEADRPFTVYADGDPLVELPALVGILPGAVRVLVPAGSRRRVLATAAAPAEVAPS